MERRLFLALIAFALLACDSPRDEASTQPSAFDADVERDASARIMDARSADVTTNADGGGSVAPNGAGPDTSQGAGAVGRRIQVHVTRGPAPPSRANVIFHGAGGERLAERPTDAQGDAELTGPVSMVTVFAPFTDTGPSVPGVLITYTAVEHVERLEVALPTNPEDVRGSYSIEITPFVADGTMYFFSYAEGRCQLLEVQQSPTELYVHGPCVERGGPLYGRALSPSGAETFAKLDALPPYDSAPKVPVRMGPWSAGNPLSVVATGLPLDSKEGALVLLQTKGAWFTQEAHGGGQLAEGLRFRLPPFAEALRVLTYTQTATAELQVTSSLEQPTSVDAAVHRVDFAHALPLLHGAQLTDHGTGRMHVEWSWHTPLRTADVGVVTLGWPMPVTQSRWTIVVRGSATSIHTPELPTWMMPTDTATVRILNVAFAESERLEGYEPFLRHGPTRVAQSYGFNGQVPDFPLDLSRIEGSLARTSWTPVQPQSHGHHH